MLITCISFNTYHNNKQMSIKAKQDQERRIEVNKAVNWLKEFDFEDAKKYAEMRYAVSTLCGKDTPLLDMLEQIKDIKADVKARANGDENA